jgi:hypothetical protein
MTGNPSKALTAHARLRQLLLAVLLTAAAAPLPLVVRERVGAGWP